MSDNVFDVADYGKKINTSVNVFKRLFIVYGIAAFLCTVAGVYLVANPSVAMDAQDSEYAVNSQCDGKKQAYLRH